MLHMIDRIQVAILHLPGKWFATGGFLALAAFALTVNPYIGAAALTFLSAFLALLTSWYWFAKNEAIKERDRIATEHAKLVDRVEQIELQSHVLAQAMLPVSAAFQAILVKELTHMHTPEMDGLMVKLGPPFTLTEPEADRLASLLDARTRDQHDEITPSERDAAAMMPPLMRRVRVEAAEQVQPSPTLLSLTAIVRGQDGTKKAMILHTAADAGLASVEKAISAHDTWEHAERDVLVAAIAENTKLTREANAAAHELIKRKD